MSQEFVEAQLKRCRFLLGPEYVKTTLVETKPERDPANLGALGGAGFKSEDGTLVSVYVFEDWGKHAEVAERLKSELAGPEKLYSVAGTNGPLLLFGYTRVDGPDGIKAKYQLAKIASAFAGEE